MKKFLILISAFVAVALVGLFIVKGVENRAISHEESIGNAESVVKAEEKRRFDLIPNLVECVKAYDEHEYKTLVELAKARTGNGDADAKQIKDRISVVVERYPELQSQKNYQDLMNELAITENKIVEVRKAYNTEVTRYNRFTRQFPNKELLSLCGYEAKNYTRLEFENSSVDAPKVSFN